jgi:hypothetical protein
LGRQWKAILNIRGVVLIAGHGGKSTRKMLGDRPDWVMDVLDSHHFFLPAASSSGIPGCHE